MTMTESPDWEIFKGSLICPQLPRLRTLSQHVLGESLLAGSQRAEHGMARQTKCSELGSSPVDKHNDIVEAPLTRSVLITYL